MSKARARRLKRKIKEGRPTLAPDEYKRRRQQQEEGERRNRQILQQKRLFPAPADLEREKFEEYAPGLCCDLREHKVHSFFTIDSLESSLITPDYPHHPK